MLSKQGDLQTYSLWHIWCSSLRRWHFYVGLEVELPCGEASMWLALIVPSAFKTGLLCSLGRGDRLFGYSRQHSWMGGGKCSQTTWIVGGITRWAMLFWEMGFLRRRSVNLSPQTKNQIEQKLLLLKLLTKSPTFLFHLVYLKLMA